MPKFDCISQTYACETYFVSFFPIFFFQNFSDVSQGAARGRDLCDRVDLHGERGRLHQQGVSQHRVGARVELCWGRLLFLSFFFSRNFTEISIL